MTRASNGSDKSTERREQILEAAAVALAEVGFENITTRRIAQKAGVNVATLHYHFGTKEALLAEAVRHALSRAVGVLRPAMAGAATPAEALAAGIDTAWVLAQERPGILRYHLAVRSFQDPEAKRQAAGIYAAYRRLVEEVAERHLAEGGALAPGVTPAGLAHYVVTAVDGILLQHLVTADEGAARSSLDILRRHALSLLQSGPAPAEE
uniref:HTH tetR-type domain-containing protein n=1 Tax=uncultured Armatimonadetes bacterium TaxID=157466 RepID=A0A6J4HJB7_9BACT|nr:hypothetical protein AVDCRST_MAG63-587 [uncultured Armatimonadetes bacterium]